jgi:hypothetical protein
MKALTLPALLLLLAACATPTLRIEVEHVSHPGAGWPFGPEHTLEPVGPDLYLRRSVEHELDQANALFHWQRDGWYADAGLGVNLQGKDGGGFRGPPLTGTVRIGREFRLVKP